MTSTWYLALLAAALSFLPAARQESGAGAGVADAERARLEEDFARRMRGAKLVGFFIDDEADEDTALSEESYEIAALEKQGGDRWRIEAGIQYGGQSFRFPVVLDVLWAGDTPVLSLTDYQVPLLGTFTARVMIHGERYAGIWSGAGHGGQMFGRVVPAATEREPELDGDELDGDGEPGRGGDAERASRGKGVDVHWPSFRGPEASGLSEGSATVSEFDVLAGENVLWRRPVPGLAHSSPVIHGERLYLTSAVRTGAPSELRVGLYGDIGPVKDEGEHEFVVHGYDKRDGRLLWERTAWSGVPAFQRHPKGSFAASTPATDGRRVVAFFGTEGLYCYDAEGELVWMRDLGPLDAGYFMVKAAQWGFASSPIVHEGRVIVQCDVQGDSFLAVLDLETGEDLWRRARDEVPTWSTPTVVVRPGRSQIVCNGWKHMGGYDLETGKELWWLRGGGDIPVPTPVVAGELVFLTNAHGMLAPIYAIELGAEGELSFESEGVAWSQRRRGNYMQTPIAYGEEIYFCSDSGVLTCYDLRSGAEHYRERLGSGSAGFSASPVAADGKLYFTGESGEVHVVAAGTRFEPLSISALGEEAMATPAISEGVIYWRTRGHLVAVGER